MRALVVALLLLGIAGGRSAREVTAESASKGGTVKIGRQKIKPGQEYSISLTGIKLDYKRRVQKVRRDASVVIFYETETIRTFVISTMRRKRLDAHLEKQGTILLRLPYPPAGKQVVIFIADVVSDRSMLKKNIKVLSNIIEYYAEKTPPPRPEGKKLARWIEIGSGGY